MSAKRRGSSRRGTPPRRRIGPKPCDPAMSCTPSTQRIWLTPYATRVLKAAPPRPRSRASRSAGAASVLLRQDRSSRRSARPPRCGRASAGGDRRTHRVGLLACQRPLESAQALLEPRASCSRRSSSTWRWSDTLGRPRPRSRSSLGAGWESAPRARRARRSPSRSRSDSISVELLLRGGAAPPPCGSARVRRARAR